MSEQEVAAVRAKPSYLVAVYLVRIACVRVPFTVHPQYDRGRSFAITLIIVGFLVVVAWMCAEAAGVPISRTRLPHSRGHRAEVADSGMSRAVIADLFLLWFPRRARPVDGASGSDPSGPDARPDGTAEQSGRGGTARRRRKHLDGRR